MRSSTIVLTGALVFTCGVAIPGAARAADPAVACQQATAKVVGLLQTFLQGPIEQTGGRSRIAVVTDVRAPGFAETISGFAMGASSHVLR